jgi:hypothetical protein
LDRDGTAAVLEQLLAPQLLLASLQLLVFMLFYLLLQASLLLLLTLIWPMFVLCCVGSLYGVPAAAAVLDVAEDPAIAGFPT